MEDNTASERNRTVAATYGCKILQPYEYDANVYGYDANCEWTPQEYQSMQHKRQLITELGYFCISLNSTCFKIKIIITIKNNNKKYYVLMKVRSLIRHRIRIGRRLHVNQP